MIAALSPILPNGAAFWQRLCLIMDIVLHLGAHRTGTTTFQAYLKDKTDILDQAGIAIWRPSHTRKGLFDGLIPNAMNKAWRKDMQRRAEGRVKMRLSDQASDGYHTTLISDENMLGSIQGNIRDSELYPAAGERMSRFLRAFGGRVERVVMSVRSLDTYWASSLSHSIERGYHVASARKIDDLASSPRSWRHVILDVACALPEAKIQVMPYESYCVDPRAVLRTALNGELPTDIGQDAQHWINRALTARELRKILSDRDQSPDQLPDVEGVWQPFSYSQKTALQEAYADDLFWLAQGADGLATLTEDAIPASGHIGTDGRGHNNDEEGRLDSTGRERVAGASTG